MRDTAHDPAPAAGRGSPPGDPYPWAREHEAIEALTEFDLGRCREALERLASEIRLSDRSRPGSRAKDQTLERPQSDTWIERRVV